MTQSIQLNVSTLSTHALSQTLEQTNEKTLKYNLSLGSSDIAMLVQSRAQTLTETRRIEFGHGILPELIEEFKSSPFLFQENYAETLAVLQEAFYRLKEMTEETLSDENLIAAMRVLFDSEAEGACGYFDEIDASVLVAAANSGSNDQHAQWSEHELYEQLPKQEQIVSPDETDRIYEGSRCERPDNDYAKDFYEAYNELYRIGFDYNSRIGGSNI